jgi:membrane-associated phospholipid phosphatase
MKPRSNLISQDWMPLRRWASPFDWPSRKGRFRIHMTFKMTFKGPMFLGSVVAMGVLSWLAACFGAFPGDEEVLRGFQSLRSEALDDAMRGLSWLGHVGVGTALTVGLGVLLLLAKRGWESLACLMIGIAPGINALMKEAVGRPRPEYALFQPPPSSLGFPSGHALFAVTFFGFVAFLILQTRWNRWLKGAIASLLGLIIAGIGGSRVYLGVHWPSDVAGGFLAGGIFLAMIINLTSTYLMRETRQSSV